jgi:hypothetical protein
VGVLPLMTEHTCDIAASSEAKSYGVKIGTGVAVARALSALSLIHQIHRGLDAACTCK